jgi:hypothetical protein
MGHLWGWVNPTAKREYERMLAQEWQKAKSFVKTERIG